MPALNAVVKTHQCWTEFEHTVCTNMSKMRFFLHSQLTSQDFSMSVMCKTMNNLQQCLSKSRVKCITVRNHNSTDCLQKTPVSYSEDRGGVISGTDWKMYCSVCNTISRQTPTSKLI